MYKKTEGLSQEFRDSQKFGNYSLFDIRMKMNSHSLERTIKQRVLEVFGMVCYHGCELFRIDIECY